MLIVLNQALNSPFTSCVIIFLVGIWSFSTTSTINELGYSYKEVVKEKKIFRVFWAAINHISFVHLLFTVTTLWGSIRFVELDAGTLFVFKNTVIVIAFTAVMVLSICHALIPRIGPAGQVISEAVSYFVNSSRLYIIFRL